MNDLMTTIAVTVLGSNALFAFIQFLVSRHDSKKSVRGKLTILEKDVLRTQLLLLLLLKPEEKQEILTLGEHYFTKPPEGLGGNWYMTSMFNKWLASSAEGKPEWFND